MTLLRTLRVLLPIGLLASCGLAGAAGAETPAKLGGFSLTDLAVDRALLVAGGPGKDGIRSVDAPEFSDIGTAGWVGRDTEVLGVTVGGEARAYPVRFLEYHQIVNDVIGGVPVVVTYDPLAGSPAAYRATVDGRKLTFGVSGLLYNHNFLLFDRETESLWSQIPGVAVAGALSGKRLERVEIRQETTSSWIAGHMETVFLRPPFPEKVNYLLAPYRSYWIEDRIPFPVAAKDERYHAKELVLGAVVDGVERAYLGSIVLREGGVLEDKFGEKELRVRYDSDSGTFGWEADEGVDVSEAYWLAWKAFHPDTEIWRETPARD